MKTDPLYYVFNKELKKYLKAIHKKSTPIYIYFKSTIPIISSFHKYNFVSVDLSSIELRNYMLREKNCIRYKFD